jgi:DNA-binding response OmpR family regulator
MAGRPRILLVEDDADIARLLGHYLGRRYDVETASDGLAGLTAALRTPPPDLIITDVMMPKLDGFAMVTKLRTLLTTSKPPVIFLTARGAPKDIVEGIQAGARHYLTKPVNFAELDQKLKKVLPVPPQ